MSTTNPLTIPIHWSFIVMFRPIIIALCTITVATELPHPFSDEFIHLINSKQSSWTAGRNFPADTSLEDFKKLMGTLKDGRRQGDLEEKIHGNELIANLPDHFDASEKWPNCPSINEIRDQGGCGSCWAFGAVEAMTDRYCIYSNGTKQFHFSPEDLLSCCEYCNLECEGGLSRKAWQYWKESGIVSGGSYKSNQGCMPYEIPPCKIYDNGTIECHSTDIAPKCLKSCREGYDTSYDEDKRYGKEIYEITGGEDQIKAEIFENGPVEASFEVYEDFGNFKTGVYRHIQGRFLALHSLKILGWGEENSTKYWLIANSWSPKWGNAGFFKILRGENHCSIEESVLAGVPIIK